MDSEDELVPHKLVVQQLLTLKVVFKDAILSDAEASSAAKTKFLANWMTERKLV